MLRPLARIFVAVIVGACAASPGASGGSTAPSASPAASVAPAASASADVASSAISAEAVVLRVSTVEPAESPEGQAVTLFADQIARLSKGSMSVLSLIPNGESDQENIKQVMSGEIDLAIVQARNWDEFGVTSMQALQTPFLITSDAAAAAATSTGALADRMMSGLAAKGVQGLALWPIDLRHPVSFGKPLLSPDDFAGKKIRIVGSTITRDVIKALGALPVAEYDDSVGGGESAYDRAYSLPGPGTFTGNVTFYPRVDVFFVKQSVLDGLSLAQQDVLHAAVDATRQHVIDGIAQDADQAKAYCDDTGGSVALANEEQLAAFGKALQPVEATIDTDPIAKDLIAEIRTLSQGLPSPDPVVACGP